MAVQVAVCAVLLLNSVLLVRGLRTAMAMDPGMARENVLSRGIRLSAATVHAAARTSAAGADAGAGGSTGRRRTSRGLEPVAVHGPEHDARDREQDAGGESGPSNPSIVVLNQEVSEGYLETMGIPLRAGRMFTESERKSAALVVLVSEDFVRVAFGGANPLGPAHPDGPGRGRGL